MTITQTDNALSVVDTVIEGYAYVRVVQKITSTTTAIFSSSVTSGTSSYLLTSDGLYNIISIKLPTSPVEGGYYTTNSKIYQTVSGVDTEIPLEDFLELETGDSGYNGVREEDYIINIYDLTELYFKVVQDIMCTSGTCSFDKMKVVLRDTLIMGIGVINYLIQYELFYEANNIIEKLQICTVNINYTCNCHG